MAEQLSQITIAEKSQHESRARVAADQARAEAVQAARADAEARNLQSAAHKSEMLAQAEGQRALVDADNAINEGVMAMKVELAKLEAMPRVVAEMVKPAEKIDSIRIHHVSGLGRASGGESQGPPSARTPINRALDSILDMAVQLPALKKLGDDLGMSLDGGLSGVTDVLKPAPQPRSEP